MKLLHRIMFLLLAAASLIAPSRSALAQFGAIQTATADLTAHTLTIKGVGFNVFFRPVVSFGTTTLPVQSFSGNTVVATLPANVAAGTYALGLNSIFFNCDNFSVTIGATGATGAQGPQGVMGLTGAQGPQGAMGLTGAQGPVGPVGAAGAAGHVGATGAAGPQGAQGPQGPVGQTGATGPSGAQGAAGAQGTKGDKGDQGAQGQQGPQGAQGQQGPAGQAGQNGAQGPAGPTGPAGAQGLTGGQVWTAKAVLPNQVSNGIFIPVGITPTATFATATFLQDALSLPQSCTASNFHVTTLGTLGGNAATVDLEVQDVLNGAQTSTSVLSCTVYGDLSGAGAATSCSSSASAPLNANSLIAFTASQFGHREDYYGSTMLVSFTCQ